ncbi:MAG TPA: hemolysin family protein [Myxococcota bacterium]|nr:hemolysin family protein [Myxococcota bacterium]
MLLQELLIILGLVLLNGIFAGAEIALIALRRSRLRELASEGSRGARAALALKDRPERLLATVQIGITAVGASAAAYGGSTIARDLTPVLQDLGAGRYAEEAAFGLVVVAITYLSVVLGELVPKSLALQAAEGYALAVSRPLVGLAALMRPLVWLLTASANAILLLFRDSTTFVEARHSPEELQQYVEDAAEDGSLDPRAGEIASRAFEFGELPVAAVMVPRRQIVAIDATQPPEAIRDAIVAGGYARFPVHEGHLEAVQGYVVAREVLGVLAKGRPLELGALVRPIHFVPDTTTAAAALKELQRLRTPLALVVHEVGAVVGLVTIEDLVEELVGEILSEDDEPPPPIEPEEDGSYVVQGSLALHEVNRALHIELPDEEADTIGGLCVARRGWIPRAGERFEFDTGIVLEVLEATPRRVISVRVRLPAPPPADAPDAAAGGA